MRKPPIIAALLLAVLSAITQTAAAQTASKTMRIVVPFPPGGPSDYSARVVALKLPEYLGQPVIVDNRPGASGTLGAEMVARSAPDGNTPSIVNVGTLTVLPHLLVHPINNERKRNAV